MPPLPLPRRRLLLACSTAFYGAFMPWLYTLHRFELLRPPLHDATGLLAQAEAQQPDLVLLDTAMPGFHPELHVHGLGQIASQPYLVAVVPAFGSGILYGVIQSRALRGTLLRHMALSPLLAPILTGVARGQVYTVPASPLIEKHDLNSTEYQMLALLALGLDKQQIMSLLGISERYYWNVQSNMRRGLNAETNEAALAYAIRDGLVGVFVTPDPDDRGPQQVLTLPLPTEDIG